MFLLLCTFFCAGYVRCCPREGVIGLYLNGTISKESNDSRKCVQRNFINELKNYLDRLSLDSGCLPQTWVYGTVRRNIDCNNLPIEVQYAAKDVTLKSAIEDRRGSACKLVFAWHLQPFPDDFDYWWITLERENAKLILLDEDQTLNWRALGAKDMVDAREILNNDVISKLLKETCWKSIFTPKQRSPCLKRVGKRSQSPTANIYGR